MTDNRDWTTESDEELIPESELVPEDDAIIGRAFRWSVIVIVAAVAVGALAFLLFKPAPEEEVVIEKELGDVTDRVVETEQMPQIPFTDITSDSGITFVHENGAAGRKLLPETKVSHSLGLPTPPRQPENNRRRRRR